MMTRKRIRFRIICTCFFLVLVLVGLSLFSFAKFGTINFPKVAIAFISISQSNNEYIELKSDPHKIILASPDNAMQLFAEYMNEQGYVILEEEQLGGLIVVSRHGEKETISFATNRYYSKWEWI